MKNISIIMILLTIIFAFCSCLNIESNNQSNIYYSSSSEIDNTSVFSVNGERIKTNSYELYIPKGYSIADNHNSIKLENNKEGISICIEEYDYFGKDFNQFIADSISFYKNLGADVSDPIKVSIGVLSMQRTKLTYMPMISYVYYADLGNKVVLISVITQKDNLSSNEADEVLKEINLKKAQ